VNILCVRLRADNENMVSGSVVGTENRHSVVIPNTSERATTGHPKWPPRLQAAALYPDGWCC
jgi:hypothetical protein